MLSRAPEKDSRRFLVAPPRPTRYATSWSSSFMRSTSLVPSPDMALQEECAWLLEIVSLARVVRLNSGSRASTLSRVVGAQLRMLASRSRSRSTRNNLASSVPTGGSSAIGVVAAERLDPFIIPSGAV